MTTHNAQNVFVLYFFFSSIVQTLGDLPKKGHTKSCFVLRFRHLLIGGPTPTFEMQGWDLVLFERVFEEFARGPRCLNRAFDPALLQTSNRWYIRSSVTWLATSWITVKKVQSKLGGSVFDSKMVLAIPSNHCGYLRTLLYSFFWIRRVLRFCSRHYQSKDYTSVWSKLRRTSEEKSSSWHVYRVAAVVL